MECKLSTFECLSLYVAPWSPEFRNYFAFHICLPLKTLLKVLSWSHVKAPICLPTGFCAGVSCHLQTSLPYLLSHLWTRGSCGFNLLSAAPCRMHSSVSTYASHSPALLGVRFFPPFSFLLPLPCWHCKKRIPLKGPEPLSLYAPDSNPGCNRHPTTSRKWEILGYNETHWIFFFLQQLNIGYLAQVFQ